MKNFLLVLALVIAAIGAVVSLNTHMKLDGLSEDYVDSTSVIQLAQDQANPVFSSLEEIVSYRANMIEENFVDSVFCSMPAQTLTDVSNVVLGKYKTAKKKCIVEEFIAHPDIYTNLHPNDPNGATTNSTPPDPEVEHMTDSVNKLLDYVGSTHISYRDTIIDGKQKKIKTVIRETYE